jgi:UDP-glucose 4-epimerase
MGISLITGGAGFIGSHVVNELVKNGHKVVVLDDLSGGFRNNVNPNAMFVQGSVEDYELLDRLFNEHKFEYVYHLAAYAAEGLSHFIKRFNYRNNLIGSVNLINESVKHSVKCFVFTSSIAVYGKQTPPMSEDMTPMPEDPYGIAKYAVEMELKVTHEMFGLNYVIFRPHNVYGEYQNIGDRYRNVVGIFMNQLLRGKTLTIFGDGEQKRAFSYIGDVAPAIAASATLPETYSQIYNIGADKHYTVNELATAVMETMGMKTEICHLPARNEVTDAWCTHAKAARTFNLHNPTSLKDGLLKMAEWVKKAGSRKGQRFKEIEIMQKLPLIWLEE